MDDVIGSPDLDEDKSIPVASCKTKYGSKSRGQKKKTIKGRCFFFFLHLSADIVPAFWR